MFKSKSFNLHNEDTSKQTKQLYQPRRMRWLKFILLPVATCFVIFLVVYNIDFSNESFHTNTTLLSSYFDKTSFIYFKGFESTKSNIIINQNCTNGTFGKEIKVLNISTENLELRKIKDLSANILCKLSGHSPSSYKIYIKYKQFGKVCQYGMNNMNYLQSNIYTTSIDKLRKSRSAVNLIDSTLLETIDPNYSTTPLTTTATPRQTARTKTSTKTTPSISVNDSTHSTTMICVSPTKEIISNKSVPYNGHIQIVDYSSKSVKVVLSQVDLEFWKLVYFSNYSQMSYVEINEADGTLYDAIIELEFLSCNTAFVFCLLSDENRTSPFNCQSHQTMTCDAKNSWFIEQSSLIIGIGMAGILCSGIFGSIAMYCTLKFRPTWLHGSKRLVRLVRDSQTMYLLPKNLKNEQYGSSKNQLLATAASEYVEYFRHLEQGNIYKSGSNNYNIPPQDSAPSVPIPHYTYESFELYEELV